METFIINELIVRRRFYKLSVVVFSLSSSVRLNMLSCLTHKVRYQSICCVSDISVYILSSLVICFRHHSCTYAGVMLRLSNLVQNLRCLR